MHSITGDRTWAMLKTYYREKTCPGQETVFHVVLKNRFSILIQDLVNHGFQFYYLHDELLGFVVPTKTGKLHACIYPKPEGYSYIDLVIAGSNNTHPLEDEKRKHFHLKKNDERLSKQAVKMIKTLIQ